MKKQVLIQVERAACFAQVRNENSFRYKFSEMPPRLLDRQDIWSKANCPIASSDAEESFFLFLEEGKHPDFTRDIDNVTLWLSEHGHKTGDWAGMVANYKNSLSFFEGGYKALAAKVQVVEVVYNVKTIKPYAFGTSSYDGPTVPHLAPGDFTYIKKGYA